MSREADPIEITCADFDGFIDEVARAVGSSNKSLDAILCAAAILALTAAVNRAVIEMGE